MREEIGTDYIVNNNFILQCELLLANNKEKTVEYSYRVILNDYRIIHTHTTYIEGGGSMNSYNYDEYINKVNLIWLSEMSRISIEYVQYDGYHHKANDMFNISKISRGNKILYSDFVYDKMTNKLSSVIYGNADTIEFNYDDYNDYTIITKTFSDYSTLYKINKNNEIIEKTIPNGEIYLYKYLRYRDIPNIKKMVCYKSNTDVDTMLEYNEVIEGDEIKIIDIPKKEYYKNKAIEVRIVDNVIKVVDTSKNNDDELIQDIEEELEESMEVKESNKIKNNIEEELKPIQNKSIKKICNIKELRTRLCVILVKDEGVFKEFISKLIDLLSKEEYFDVNYSYETKYVVFVKYLSDDIVNIYIVTNFNEYKLYVYELNKLTFCDLLNKFFS